MRFPTWGLCLAALSLSACSEVTLSVKPDDDVPIFVPDDTDVPDTDPPETLALPELTFDPPALDFGYVDEGASKTLDVVVTNVGDAPLALSDLAVSGASSFTWTTDTEPFALGMGESAPIAVTFTPGNTDDAGTLDFASNDPYAPTSSVPLNGTGKNPLVVGSPSPLVFSSVLVGDVDVRTLTLTNVGNAPVTVSDVTSNEPVFAVVPLGSPLVIAAQDSATVDVVFTPAGSQAYAGDLTIASDARVAAVPVPVQAEGIGVPDAVCGVTPSRITSLGEGATFSAAGSSDPSGRPLTFAWTFTTKPVGSTTSFAGTTPGASERGPLVPDVAGTYVARVVATNDLGLASDPCDVTLTVDALPKLVANPTSLNFGSVAIGGTSQRSFTLTNVGNAPATITGVPSTSPRYTVSGSGPVTLDPGDAHTVNATFRPVAAGSVSASLSPTSNAILPAPVVFVSGSSPALDPVADCRASAASVVAIHESFYLYGDLSTDPGGAPLTYTWSFLSTPPGSSVTMPSGVANRGPITPDVVGDYVARLTVTNPSGRSDACEITVAAEPNADLWVEMFWVVPYDDMDLHLVRANGTLNTDQDCYFGNCDDGYHPSWGAPGTADDPFLDLDDIDGDGPENINIASPEATFYRVVVHDYYGWAYWDDNAVTVRIHVDGQLVYNQTKIIDGEDTYTTFALIDFTNPANPTVVPQ